jgi:membrane fusion protein (multidrug efflux system)
MRHAPSLLLVFFVTLMPGCHEARSGGKEMTPPVLVEVMKVDKTSRNIERHFSGFTYPWESHGVGFLVGGRITDIKVEDGEFVKKGMLLATIDPSDFALVEKLAETKVKALKPNFERIGKLVEQQALPQSQLDDIQAQYEAALTEKTRAKKYKSWTRLLSPIDGIVIEKMSSIGQVIGPGMPVVVIIDLKKVKVEFGVTQKDLGLFHVGDEARLTFQGIEGEKAGKVFHIDDVADPSTRTYSVAVEIQNDDGSLRAGMLAHMVVTAEKVEGFFVPLHCVKRTSEEASAVMVVESATRKAELRKVMTGRLIGEDVEITSGLKEGDLVITSGQEQVHEGDRVTMQ